MKGTKHMKRTTNPIYSTLALFAFACLALSPHARATCYANCLTDGNTVFGDDALVNNTGHDNTAIGFDALLTNTTGIYNTAIGGSGALYQNTTGNYNTASGAGALFSNTTGSSNSAVGFSALTANTFGEANTASGVNALYYNTSGSYNTANGADALLNNRTGGYNTANGFEALHENRSGGYNTATGVYALFDNTTGSNNTANGVSALTNNTSGNRNIAVGFRALYNNNGSDNVGLGFNAGNGLTTGSGNVCIGAGILGAPGESNTTRIRNIYSSVASGRAVYINSNNKIGTLASTRRVKENIKPMEKASEAVLALKPVSFRYNKEIDPSGTPQFGLVAEEVAEIDPDLVTRDSSGQPETVRYDAVNAMLLNEFLKEHSKVEKLEATVAKQHKDFEAALADLKEQIQKVSAQLELNKPAPQTVLNDQ